MSGMNKSIKLCVYCNEKSKFECQRCTETYYCSQQCQKNDWQSHRYICFPLPALIPLSDLDETVSNESMINESINLEAVSQDSMQKEAPTNLEQKLDVTSEEDDSRLKKYPSNLSQKLEVIIEEKASDITVEEPEIKVLQDTIIGTISELDNSFYEEEEELIDVLKHIQIESTKNEKNLEIISAVKEPDVGYQVNGKVTKGTDKILFYKDLKAYEWPQTKNIKVKLQCIVQEPNIISFIEDKKLIDDFYIFMESEIQKYRSKVSFRKYLPKRNEIVLGHFNGTWNRACCLDPAKEGIVVLFIDYGTMEVLSMDEILPISSEISIAKLSFEVCSRQFIVDNIPVELNEKQKDILESGRMMITKIRTDNRGKFHCEIFGF